MNILKSLAVKDVEEATRDIPIIDFSPAFRLDAGESGALEALADQVRHASETVGFFYLAGHGVPEAVVDAAFAASREFHALALEEKMRLSINENNIGYLPVNQSIQKASTVHKASRPNYNESFFISHDRAADHPDVVAGTPCGAATSGRPGTRRCARPWSPTSGRSRAWGSACSRCWPARSACRLAISPPSSPAKRTSICASCTIRRKT